MAGDAAGGEAVVVFEAGVEAGALVEVGPCVLLTVRIESPDKENPMTHSTLTSKGQTTLPARIREALHIKAGDRILYEIKDDVVIIRAHPGAMAVFGALRPSSGKEGVPFKVARRESREKRLKDAGTEGR